MESETKIADEDESQGLARATRERKWKFAEIWKTTKGTSQGWSGGLSVEFGQLISTCLLDIHPREATE